MLATGEYLGAENAAFGTEDIGRLRRWAKIGTSIAWSTSAMPTSLQPRSAQQIAEIDGLRDALDADGEIATGASRLGFSGSFMP